MNSWTDLVFLLQKCWSRSKILPFFLLVLSYIHLKCLTHFLYNSSDDPDACKKLLAKVGLEGYQVTNCLIKAFSIATTTCVMSNIDRLTFTFADWQDESFSESWTNGRLGYPKD